MPIRIRRHDKALIPTQLIEDSGIGMLFSVDSTAGYTGTKPKTRILCGSA
jgi:hypothetical protein